MEVFSGIADAGQSYLLARGDFNDASCDALVPALEATRGSGVVTDRPLPCCFCMANELDAQLSNATTNGATGCCGRCTRICPLGLYDARSGVPTFLPLYLRDKCGNIPRALGDPNFLVSEEKSLDVKLARIPGTENQHNDLVDMSGDFRPKKYPAGFTVPDMADLLADPEAVIPVTLQRLVDGHWNL